MGSVFGESSPLQGTSADPPGGSPLYPKPRWYAPVAVKARPFIAAATVLFLAWFTMKFHMDNANDSETRAYVGTLLWNVEHATLSTDATGHYTGVAPYVVWQFSGVLSLLTDLYATRGLALALTCLGVALYGLAYAWFAELGLRWPTRLLGLALLSVSVVFALLLRGWELDKLIEPSLFLLGALLAWRGQYMGFALVAAVAAANRESGAFMPLVALAALAQQRGSLRAALGTWPVWLAAALSLAAVLPLRSQLPPPPVRPFADLSLERLIYVAGGLCLLPVLAFAWRITPTRGLGVLLYVLSPVWLLFVLATDRLEQGALLLAPLALVWLPATLLGLEQVARPRQPESVAIPAAPAARQSAPVAPGT